MRITYRLHQFHRALLARPSPADDALVRQYLAGDEVPLFYRMPRYDQQHCLDVFHTLLAGGYTNQMLLRAALLHDCGKVDDSGRPIPLLYYGLFVVLQRWMLGLYDLAARNGRGVLRPFVIHATHEWRSATLAAAAGSPPEVVAILYDYAAHRRTPHTAALYWADEQN